MKTMVDIILSPYFTTNTKLVANFCRKCYSEEKEEDVVVTAVNVKFLKSYDPKQYQVFTNNFFFIPRIKLEVACLKEKDESSMEPIRLAIFNSNQKYSTYRTMMKMKRKIMKKYAKFNLNRKYFNSPSINPNKLKNQKQIVYKNEDNLVIDKKLETCITNGKEEINEQLIGQFFKQEQREDNSENKAQIKIEIKDEDGGKLNSLTKKLEENIFKLSKVDGNADSGKWIPPISPHNLIEEKYYNDPWALLVVTIFLNRTSCVLALPQMENFFEDFKGPYDVLKVKVDDLEPYFTKIGLIRTRANQIWRMSYDFVHKDWKFVGELYGVGKYAEDAYRMFHLGDFSVEPTDRYLKIYKAWYEMKERNEKLGILESNSQVYLEDYFISPEDEDRTEDVEKPN